MSRADDGHPSSAENTVSPTACEFYSAAVQLIRFPEIQSIVHRPLLCPLAMRISSAPCPSKPVTPSHTARKPHEMPRRCRACATALRKRRREIGRAWCFRKPRRSQAHAVGRQVLRRHGDATQGGEVGSITASVAGMHERRM
jgi:hypothetical protein